MQLPKIAIPYSIVASLLMFSHASWAQPASVGNPMPEESWSVGAGVSVSSSPYTGMKTKVTALPSVNYANSWLRFDGLSANVKLPIPSQKVSYSLRANYALSDGYKASDAPILNGMDKRKASLWVGAGLRMPTQALNYSLDVSTDALGYSKGTQAKLQVDKNFRIGKTVITPRLSTTWLDRKYVDYYYGVKDTEVTANRSRYKGKSTMNVELGVKTTYTFNPHHSVSLDVSAVMLGSQIKNSPLVSDRTQLRMRTWYAYTF